MVGVISILSCPQERTGTQYGNFKMCEIMSHKFKILNIVDFSDPSSSVSLGVLFFWSGHADCAFMGQHFLSASFSSDEISLIFRPS